MECCTRSLGVLTVVIDRGELSLRSAAFHLKGFSGTDSSSLIKKLNSLIAFLSIEKLLKLSESERT